MRDGRKQLLTQPRLYTIVLGVASSMYVSAKSVLCQKPLIASVPQYLIASATDTPLRTECTSGSDKRLSHIQKASTQNQ